MKKTLYFIIAICALGLVSCEETGYRRTTAYHYVAAYYPIDTFSIALHITKRQQVINNNYIGLHFRGDYYSKYKKDNYVQVLRLNLHILRIKIRYLLTYPCLVQRLLL